MVVVVELTIMRGEVAHHGGDGVGNHEKEQVVGHGSEGVDNHDLRKEEVTHHGGDGVDNIDLEKDMMYPGQDR